MTQPIPHKNDKPHVNQQVLDFARQLGIDMQADPATQLHLAEQKMAQMRGMTQPDQSADLSTGKLLWRAKNILAEKEFAELLQRLDLSLHEAKRYMRLHLAARSQKILHDIYAEHNL